MSASAAELVERGLAAGVSAGAASTSVIVTERSAVNLRWACNTLTTNGFSLAQRVTAVVAVALPGGGLGVGSLSRNGVDTDGIDDLVAQAAAVAGAARPAEDAADLPAGIAEDDFAEPGPGVAPADLAGAATALGAALDSARSTGRELFGYAEQSLSTTWLGTSAGARRRHVQPTAMISITGKSHQRSRSTFVNAQSRHLADLDLSAMADQVSTRLGWQARRVELTAGRYTTVLPPTSVADLLIYALWSADLRAAVEGHSVFSRPGGATAVGQRLATVPLTLGGDPTRPGLQCRPFVATGESGPFASVFDNGLDVPAVDWVDAGRLAALPSTRFTAARAGVGVAPAPDNLVLSAPDTHATLAELVADTDRGLLLTSLWYIREVDPMSLLLTGLTRDGVYLIEGGEVSAVVPNFRFNESPVDLLGRVDGIGASQPCLSREWDDYFPRTAMPPLRVADFNMSTVSPGT